MTGGAQMDNRLAAIMAQLTEFSGGKYDQRLVQSQAGDEIDAIISQLNRLGDSLGAQRRAALHKEERIERLLDILIRYTLLDFSERVPLDGNGDEIDAVAAGLNSMAEEVIYHINKVKESEAKVQAIFRHAPDAVVVIDPNDIVVQWNRSASRIFGWEEGEVIGRQLHTLLVPHAYRERHLEGMRRFLKTGDGKILNRTVEFPALCKDDSGITVELTISPLKVNQDLLFIGFLRDITNRKKAEEKIIQLNATLEQRVLERTEELKASEKKYRNLFENNPMPLWVLDVQTLRIMDVNDSAIQLYGYTRDEFLSMSSLDLRPEDERERYLNLNRQTRGTQNTGIWKHRKKDGTVFHSEVVVHEMTFGGRPARLILANDVTERVKAVRALEVSEARFRRVINSKMTGFFFWNEDGLITDANDLFLEMVGYSRQELMEGKLNLHAITPPEYTAKQAEALEQIRATGVCEPFEKEYICSDGARLPVLIGAANINEGTEISGVTCVMDISQRRKMEEEIMELNRDLEVRISERTQALQAANQELESFSYSVSHDLRAPLRAIHGYSQMLFEDYESKLDKEGMRLLNVVKFNARRMGQLVDDLLAFSRLGKRLLSLSETDLTALVREVLADLTEEESRRVKITVLPLGNAFGDANMLRQVFQNLISNAVKYSSKREDPCVEIGLSYIEGEPVYYVKDNGAGFDMAYYDKLFGVFQRLHGAEEFEGTGVGLAIVQRIVQRHGGRIWAESKVEGGATFYFTLGAKTNAADDR